MKKLIATLCLTALVTGAFAQGTIKFANTSSILVSYGTPDSTTWVPTPGAANGFYYAVLSAPLGTTDRTAFTFAGVYATNTATAGRLQGGNLLGVAMNSTWPPVTTRSFFVAGWSSDLGTAWQETWLTARPQTGYFGVSDIASGMAGGTDPVTGLNYSALVSFSGTTIANGFALTQIPEPATLALAGLGAAALLIFRRRN